MDHDSQQREWQRLFIAKADSIITAEDHQKLTQLLKDSAEARREWFAFQDAETALCEWSQRDAVQRSAVPAPAAAVGRRGRFWLLALAGAAAACMAVAGGMRSLWQDTGATALSPSGANVVTRDEATTSAVAVLTRGVDLVWESGATGPDLHELLSPGELRLKSGVAEIEFFQGTRLCMEGPAIIRLVSAAEAYCSSGRFSAEVPPHARGFRIGTPKGDLVDLGTEFGLDLSSPTPALHVFKGEVEWYQPKAQMRLLTTGQAAGLEADPATPKQNADPAAFSTLR